MKSILPIPFVLTVVPSLAATINLLPVADGHIADNGALGFNVTEAADNVLTVSSGRDTRGVFEFDLSSVPSDSTITSVEFIVTTSAGVSNTQGTAPVDVFSVPGDGSITVSDFNSAGTLQHAEVLTLPVSGGTTLVLPMSDLSPFQGAIEGSGEIALRTDTVNFVTFRVHSHEAGVAPELKPNLRVTYIPEPATLGSLFFALILLGRRSR